MAWIEPPQGVARAAELESRALELEQFRNDLLVRVTGERPDVSTE